MDEKQDNEHEYMCNVASRNVAKCEAVGERGDTCDAVEGGGTVSNATSMGVQKLRSVMSMRIQQEGCC